MGGALILEFIGAAIRWLCYRGKKPFNALFYDENDRSFFTLNSRIGILFSIVLMAILILT